MKFNTRCNPVCLSERAASIVWGCNLIIWIAQGGQLLRGDAAINHVGAASAETGVVTGQE